MSIFTLEVAGRPIACIRAETSVEAEQVIDDPWFRDGLLGLERDGEPVWNGEADLHVRGATAEEEVLIEGMMAQRSQGAGDEKDKRVILLPSQPVTTPSEHKLILASRVEHTPVYNEAGQRLGHIEDLSIDRRSGEVVYAIMSFGGFLGIGKSFHPIPWHLLRYDPNDGGYVVPLDQQALASAPHYGAEELGELGGTRHDYHRSDLMEYYGRFGPPYI